MLGNDAALDMVTGADIWEINANEAVAYQYSRYNYNVTIFFNANDPFATSDHNPEIVGVDVPGLHADDDRRRSRSSAPTTSTVGCCRTAATPPVQRRSRPRSTSCVPRTRTPIFAAAGDLIGASTFESFVQDDEPTIDALNEMGLEVSAAGNHEFDQGYDDLVGRESQRPLRRVGVHRGQHRRARGPRTTSPRAGRRPSTA